MITLKQALQDCSTALQSHYCDREAYAISHMLIEHLTQFSKLDVLVHANDMLSEQQLQNYHAALERLQQQEPIQYVLGYAWFMNKQLAVNNAVLIPRPETEELVMEVKKMYADISTDRDHLFKMVDIGTGSGCIAIALKKYFPDWDVWAVDKYNGALAIAKKNAVLLDTEVRFVASDILKEAKTDFLPAFDLIISNPPYIPTADRSAMDDRVLDHEPHAALFVTDNDPLQFYKAIIAFSEQHLLRGGMLFFETHELYAQEVAALLEANGFEHIVVKKDFQEKERIVMGRRAGASL